jgi:hypothetical protein
VLTAVHDAFACCHCNATVFLKAAADPTSQGAILYGQPHWQSENMGVCLACTDGFQRGLICPACEAEQHRTGKCINFERRLELREARGDARRRMLQALGI